VDVHFKKSIGALKTIAVGKQLHLKMIGDICFFCRIAVVTSLVARDDNRYSVSRAGGVTHRL